MNEVKIFNNPLFGEVRVFIVNNEPWFVGKDVALLLGYAKPENALSTHVDDEDKTITLIQGTGSNYKSNTTIINESGMYSLVFGSRLKTAKEFKRWVTSDVLPSIRKTGGYIATTQEDTPELIMAKALQVAQATINKHQRMLEQANERIALQDTQLKQQAPKVKYVDDVLQSVNTYTSTQMSKELGLREAEQLHKILKEKGVMFKQSGQWMLTAKYCEHGYTKPRTHQFTRNDGSVGTSTTTVWTEKGRVFLHNMFNLKKAQETA